ncbi:tetratricopeptide repeat-containing sensor histidine kinase [Spirosoma sp.]|uniref:ATP-binding protein n=1 Tax=Spirosoma sp. TaxID=1899569 RepID=UPI00262CBC18|nr:tetratricopeptide repeat-containing sensor histidine kinase [Spirosoma sp.]MCX6214691.1 tetratricopeptide repeat-containing sensor histidine kinase [Spirosoma sp.]
MTLARKYSFGLFMMAWLTGHAQPIAISTLRLQLARATADSSRSNLCYRLGEQYEQVNFDSCLYYLNKSIQISQRIHDPVATARAMYRLGQTYIYTLKDEAKAVDWFNKAILLAKASNNNACLADCYRLLAVCADHQRIGNMEELIGKAVSYAKKSNDWRILTNTYQVYCDMYVAHKNYPLAEKYSRLAMASCKPYNLDNWFTSGLDLHDLLVVQGKQAQALVLASQLASLKDKLPKTDGEFVYVNDAAKLERILKHYTNAEAILLNGIIAENQRTHPDSLHLRYFYQNLLHTYVDQGKWQKAYTYSEKLADIRLWLQQKRQTQDARLQMTQLKAALDIEKKDSQIVVLDAQRQQQRIFLIAALLVAGLLVGFIVVQRRNQKRIERQKAALTQLNATQNKLFAMLSHDLRSPVANLQSNVMLTNWGALSQQEFAESTQSLSLDIGNVTTMLDNVLSWSISQMNGIKPRVEIIKIALLIEEQMAFLTSLANAKQIQLVNNTPVDACLLADKNHLSAILRNLLQNAIKFTHAGGAVWVDFLEREGFSRLTVRDTGIGMEPQLVANLFALDKQTSRLGTNHEQGTGLGLLLVKELVEANQGHITVNSAVDEGTMFTLTFANQFGMRTGSPVL